MRRPLPLENHSFCSAVATAPGILEKPIRGAEASGRGVTETFPVLNSNEQRRDEHGCRSVELRALCNEVPRTPPGPEGSNGIGSTSGAADHPKFLAPKSSLQSTVEGRKPALGSVIRMLARSRRAYVFYGLRGACVFRVGAQETEREFEIT